MLEGSFGFTSHDSSLYFYLRIDVALNSIGTPSLLPCALLSALLYLVVSLLIVLQSRSPERIHLLLDPTVSWLGTSTNAKSSDHSYCG